jgi:hypothetical protein
MKNLILTIAALASVSAASMLLARDATILGNLKSLDSVTKKVTLDKGESEIEVYSTYEKVDLTCQFFDSSGNLALVQKNTDYCHGKSNLIKPDYVKLIITNNQDRNVDFRILVHTK